MNHLSIRKIRQALGRALEREVRRRGLSLNETVKQLLARALGLDPDHPPKDGLRRLAGGWSEAELEQFEEATSSLETIDPEQWK